MVFSMEGLFAQNNGAGLNATVDLEVSSKTTECESDLVLWFGRTGVLAGGFPQLNLGGLQFKVD